MRSKGLAALADGTMDRWFTPEFKKVNPQRWTEVRDTISGTTPAGSAGCMSAIQSFDYLERLPSIKAPTLVICGDQDAARYSRRTGWTVNRDALALYRLRWGLDDIAEFLSEIRGAHRRTADTLVSWTALRETLEAIAGG